MCNVMHGMMSDAPGLSVLPALRGACCLFYFHAAVHGIVDSKPPTAYTALGNYVA